MRKSALRLSDDVPDLIDDTSSHAEGSEHATSRELQSLGDNGMPSPARGAGAVATRKKKAVKWEIAWSPEYVALFLCHHAAVVLHFARALVYVCWSSRAEPHSSSPTRAEARRPRASPHLASASPHNVTSVAIRSLPRLLPRVTGAIRHRRHHTAPRSPNTLRRAGCKCPGVVPAVMSATAAAAAAAWGWCFPPVPGLWIRLVGRRPEGWQGRGPGRPDH